MIFVLLLRQTVHSLVNSSEKVGIDALLERMWKICGLDVVSYEFYKRRIFQKGTVLKHMIIKLCRARSCIISKSIVDTVTNCNIIIFILAAKFNSRLDS